MQGRMPTDEREYVFELRSRHKKTGCFKIQNTRRTHHPEIISGSDIQLVGTLKQVQDDAFSDF